MTFSFAYSLAFVLDLLLGDPRSIPHPVQLIGWCCATFEERARKVFRQPVVAGGVTTVLVLLTTVLGVGMVLMLAHKVATWLELAIGVFLLAASIASRSLYDHSMRVHRALRIDDGLVSARRELGMIVGRDTADLDFQAICRGCVETVAENLVDGVIAPLFFALAFSLIPAAAILDPVSMAAIGALLYKAVNTMDSMFGYKNERYRQFGKVPARLDDVANFLPARLGGLLLIAAALLLRQDFRRGFTIFVRDRLCHASPNSGHPESAVAGILGVQLGGNSSYFGTVVEKASMGDALRPLEADDIIVTNRLMIVAGLLFLGLALGLRMVLVGG